MRAQDRMFLAMHRRNESDTFTSACVIKRTAHGDGTLNETTGVYNNTGTVVYEGECLVRPADANFRRVQTPGAEKTVHVYNIKLPHNTAVNVHDVLTVTGSMDEGMVGRSMIIRDVIFDEWQTSRYIVAEEVRREF